MSNSEDNQGGQPSVYLQIQTPRGLWSRTEPKGATKRPVYPISTKIAEVIRDVRVVFGFVEDDNKYELLHGDEPLDPQHPLARYHFKDGTLLILSVQGGNAYGSIDPAASLETINNELVTAVEFAAAAGLPLDRSQLTETNLKFYVTFSNRNSEKFFARIDCRDYPLYPPFIEFVSEDRSRSGTKDLYPNVFHGMPCVCMRYSRKAYLENQGPHGDWRLIDWHLATDGGGPITNLAMIISDIHAKILASTGRMG